MGDWALHESAFSNNSVLVTSEEATKDKTEDQCVKIEHNNDTKRAADKANEAIAIVAANATAKIVGDRAVPDSKCGSSREYEHAYEEGAPAKSVFHVP